MTFSSRVNGSDKHFKDSLGYPSNLPDPINPSSLSCPSHPYPHPPNPCFKDSQKNQCV